MKLKGRTAIVTGGARNIGRDYCIRLAEDGANVIVADIRDSAETVEILRKSGANAIGVDVDVGDDASVKAMVTAALAEFQRIDILVNNAALYGDLERASLADLSVEAFDKTMAVNVRGCFLCMRAVVPAMIEAGGGSIINISSATIFGWGGSPHYVASKSAVIGLTRCLARDLGPHKIRVNAITPGFTQSQASIDILEKVGATTMRDLIVSQTALQRAQLPEDLVGAVSFLASDDAAFITGQTLNVDGGWKMP